MKYISTVLGLGYLLLLFAVPAAVESRLNVLFILVDDLGWSDVSYSGSRVYETPHVDRLARQGMVLTDFYTTSKQTSENKPTSARSSRSWLQDCSAN